MKLDTFRMLLKKEAKDWVFNEDAVNEGTEEFTYSNGNYEVRLYLPSGDGKEITIATGDFFNSAPVIIRSFPIEDLYITVGTVWDYVMLVKEVITEALDNDYYEEYFDSSINPYGTLEDTEEAIYSDEVLHTEVYESCALEWGRWENEHMTKKFSKMEIESIIDASKNIRYLNDGRRDELIESKIWGGLLREVIEYIWDRDGYDTIHNYLKEVYNKDLNEFKKRTAWKYNNMLRG
jgi:hypothetical protein